MLLITTTSRWPLFLTVLATVGRCALAKQRTIYTHLKCTTSDRGASADMLPGSFVWFDKDQMETFEGLRNGGDRELELIHYRQSLLNLKLTDDQATELMVENPLMVPINKSVGASAKRLAELEFDDQTKPLLVVLFDTKLLAQAEQSNKHEDPTTRLSSFSSDHKLRQAADHLNRDDLHSKVFIFVMSSKADKKAPFKGERSSNASGEIDWKCHFASTTIAVADNDALRNFSKTSVLFVSVSFIILMVISLAWLVFYYIQRFRYAHAKDRLARRLFNAAKKALTKIPTTALRVGDKELETDCPVCIDPYRPGDVVRVLACRHVFHKTCVDPWLLEHRTCPMCKTDILKAFGYNYGHLEDMHVRGLPPERDNRSVGGQSSDGQASSNDGSYAAFPFPASADSDPFFPSPSVSPAHVQQVLHQNSATGFTIIPMTVHSQNAVPVTSVRPSTSGNLPAAPLRGKSAGAVSASAADTASRHSAEVHVHRAPPPPLDCTPSSSAASSASSASPAAAAAAPAADSSPSSEDDAAAAPPVAAALPPTATPSTASSATKRRPTTAATFQSKSSRKRHVATRDSQRSSAAAAADPHADGSDLGSLESL